MEQQERRQALHEQREAVWAEKGWDDDALPTPPTRKEQRNERKAWSPTELGALLIRYAQTKQPIATQTDAENGQCWDRLDFSYAHLEGASLGGAYLEGAFLLGAHLEGASLGRAHLEGAFFLVARLEGADLERAHLEGADLIGACLEGADLERARLEGAFLLGAYLEGADLEGAHLEGADLTGAVGTPGSRTAARISSETITKSGWNTPQVLDWIRAGAIITDYENLPENLRRDLERNKEGLILFKPS